MLQALARDWVATQVGGGIRRPRQTVPLKRLRRDPLDRTQWLRNGLPTERPGLEIGPLDRPIMPRPGSAVLYADHLDKEGLKAKYASHAPVNGDTIPDIDFVIGQAGLRAGVGEQRLHYVIASHVIEHIPNPITWLADIHALLVDGGILVLAIPDLRRCFDALRRPSTAAEWIEAHLDNRTRPSPSRIFDAMCNEVQIDGTISWNYDPDPRDLILSRTAAAAYDLAQQFKQSGEYMDVHCWTFTPASFCNLMRTVAATGLLELKLQSITDTIGQEFLVRLSRSDTNDRADIVCSYPAAEGRYYLLPEDFDAGGYYRQNPDVKAAGMDPYDHYLQYGRNEGRHYR